MADVIEKKPFNVLFLCTGNSARSIMAETILNLAGQGNFRAFSAGSQLKGRVHPYALELLRRLHFNVSGARSKSRLEFAQSDSPKLDFVFTVCDNAAGETCPIWPGQPMTAHWGSRSSRRHRNRGRNSVCIHRYAADAHQSNQYFREPAAREA